MTTNHSALPTSSKLSRGIKGSIQRIFVGEKNNNQVVVYKYNITTQEWYKETTIYSPDSSILKFGFSLAGTDDASILAVGAPGITEGRVYIYEKDSTPNGWSQRGTTIIHPMINYGGTGSDGFGHSVALSQHDGNILVVGAPFYNERTPAFATSNDYPVCEGRVFIFKYVGGTSGWAGSAYAFQGTKSSPSGLLNTSFPNSWRDFYFGWSLDISDIGNMIIIGSPSIRDLDDIAKKNQEKGDLFFDTSVYDEYYNSVEVSDLETNWGHTGNAHVYHNHTVLSGTNSWTSNVNVTEVIDVTSIGGITVDTEPEKIRPFEAVGTSVGINRAGTRIFATAPYSYGTSNASPQIFSGRIYTLEWNSVTGTWDEMGRINKHINGGINFRLLGFSAEFDGSGNRIVAGAPEWVSINRKLRGHVETFDWNGEAWVSYPTSSVSVDVITDETFWFYQNMRFGDSVSVDGEGEMIAIGMGDKNLYYSSSSTNLPRPSQLSVYGITYIGGATTTVAGSDSHILTGSSNIWVYNNPQSMIVSGNMTVSGCMQTSGIAVGTNDDTDTSRKTIFFGGTKADNAYDYTVIENRVYESAEKSELLIFKGDNNADFNGGGIYGPDRIRLKSGQICFDLNTGYERDGEDIRFTMNKNKLQGGKFGVNTASPTEAVDVYGKIKSSQGFIGRGEELIGLDLHDSLIRVNNNTGIAGSSYNDLTLGEMGMVSSSTTYPTGNLTNNTSSGCTVAASFDVTNAWKAFDATSTGFGSAWQLDTGSASGAQGTPLYTRFGPEIGYYFGNTERFPGYPGEWIEIQMHTAPKLLLTEVLINVPGSGSFPVNLHVFGSDNGTDYYHVHTEIKPWSYIASFNTDVSVFTRTPSVNDRPYNKFVLICSRVRVPFSGVYWSNIRLKGSTLSTFTKKLKLDKTGKIGIGNANPAHALDVTDGDINISTGRNYMINGTPQKFSPFSISGGNNYEIYADNSNNKLSIGTSDFPHLVNIKGSSTTYADLLLTNNTESSSARLLLGTPLNANSSDLTTCAFKSAIIAYGNTGNSTSDLHFCLNSGTSNGASGTATLNDSRMVIANHGTYVGNVGIGLAFGNSPAHKLHVVGDIGLTGSLKEITTGNDWLPSISANGGIINDNGSLRIDLAASQNSSILPVSNGGTGVDGSAHDANGLFYYGSAVHTTLAPPQVDETILLTDTAGDAPLWALISDGLSVAPTSGPGSGPTKKIKVSLDTTSGGLAFNSSNELKVSLNTSGGLAVNNNQLGVSLATTNGGLGFNSSNELGVSLDTNGGLGFNNSNQLRIDFTNTSSIQGQLPASFVAGSGTGSSNVVAWVYDTMIGSGQPPEVTFDQGGNGYIAAIGGTTNQNNILTISGSVKIDQGSGNLYGNAANGDLEVYGNATVNGWLSKPSGSFKIDHPLPSMSNTHTLYHSFIEGPKADLIYRGKVNLVNGSASINLDTVSNMTSGTFEALNRDVQCFTTNESDWDAVKGSVSGNTLTISCQNASSTANVSWLVIGERKDKYMLDTPWTDDDGHFVPEKAKST